MAGQAGQPPADLTAELLTKGHEFSFLQVLRLLRLLGHAAETPEDPAAPVPANRTLRIRPDNSLSFPAADIAAIEKTDGEEPGFRVTATFLGLYGHASPLPTFYTEDLLEDETSDEPATRDFLDIFNHRLFALFFRCCLKYRLFFQVLEGKNAGDQERLFCLLGLGEPGLREEIPHAFSLSRYTGIVTQYPHSAWGLETMLRDAFRGVPVGVIQCFRRRVIISSEQRLCLGQAASRLGIDSVLAEMREVTPQSLVNAPRVIDVARAAVPLQESVPQCRAVAAPACANAAASTPVPAAGAVTRAGSSACGRPRGPSDRCDVRPRDSLSAREQRPSLV